MCKVCTEGNMVAEEALVNAPEVVGIVGVGMTILLAEVAGKNAHFVEQVDGAQWRVDVSTDDDDGQMTWQSVQQVTAYIFFTRSDQQYQCTVCLWVFGTADEVGECEETSVAFVAEVRDNARGQSSFGHVALHLVGYRLSIRSVQNGEL